MNPFARTVGAVVAAVFFAACARPDRDPTPLPSPKPAPAQERWFGADTSDGSLRGMGNGHMIAYGQGPDIAAFYGPPYSSPGILTLKTQWSAAIKDDVRRDTGIAIWNHGLKSENAKIAEFTDMMASDAPVYIRNTISNKPGLRFVITPHKEALVTPLSSAKSAFLIMVPAGQKVMRYPTTLVSYHAVVAMGHMTAAIDSENRIIVTCGKGEGALAIAGANDYPSLIETAEKLTLEATTSMAAKTRADWAAFTTGRLGRRPLRAHITDREKDILDSAAVVLKTQQSFDGGEIAGADYPMAYLRDMYGASRGMLALGMMDEASGVLKFVYSKFSRFGSLHNADMMGGDFGRHVHENDEVEGPGYVLLLARDIVLASKDDEPAKKTFPMLQWCYEAQTRHMASGLLPFSGDETYVAGGFFPRSGLLQGSADATLVFIESANWLASWALEEKLWTQEQFDEAQTKVGEAKNAYLNAFVRDGRIFANAPGRETASAAPRFRHGVCEGWSTGQCRYFGWTQRTSTGRYCPVCAAKHPLPEEHPKPVEVHSVSLLPAYLKSPILDVEKTRAILDRVLAQANARGHIPTIPGGKGCVGYDPGLLLFALTSIGHPSAKTAYDRMLKMIDSSGAWIEYYQDDDTPKKTACRYRPWETGVNAAAMIEYLDTPSLPRD